MAPPALSRRQQHKAEKRGRTGPFGGAQGSPAPGAKGSWSFDFYYASKNTSVRKGSFA